MGRFRQATGEQTVLRPQFAFSTHADSDGPDVLGLEWWLLADQLAFVPRLLRLIGFHVGLLWVDGNLIVLPS
ncbi:MAG: hypothetical protein ABS92_07695 [Thiobacillus sp. SCN 63-374]|nr:MAG: hypothetical protein ABS92_07695 [Thiobacillus sp. SCN 63-374]